MVREDYHGAVLAVIKFTIHVAATKYVLCYDYLGVLVLMVMRAVFRRCASFVVQSFARRATVVRPTLKTASPLALAPPMRIYVVRVRAYSSG
jgi:hypothetical protein